MNLVIIIGNLVQKPEIKKVGDRHSVTLRIATSQGDLPTEFHTVKQFTSFIDKFNGYEVGDTILVDGSAQSRSYESKGRKTWVTEIIAKKIQRLNARPQSEW
jgi:single-stranded DNA-binding protein